MLFSVLVGFWIGAKTQAHWAVSARVSFTPGSGPNAFSRPPKHPNVSGIDFGLGSDSEVEDVVRERPLYPQSSPTELSFARSERCQKQTPWSGG
jgi:hypothetical protein